MFGAMARPSPPCPSPHPPGFTLIEILVVLAIMGIAMAIAIGHGPMRSARLEMRAGAGQFADALRRAEALAISSGAPVNVVIDTRRRLYATDATPPRGFAPGLAITVLPGTQTLPMGKAAINFSPDGSSSGGGLKLTGPQGSFTVQANWLSGQITANAMTATNAN